MKRPRKEATCAQCGYKFFVSARKPYRNSQMDPKRRRLPICPECHKDNIRIWNELKESRRPEGEV